jgi:hypothetical protein
MKLPLHTGSHNGREQSTHREGLPLEIDLDEPYDELLTDWERGFSASIDAWEGKLTSRQQAKLDEIEESLELRRRHSRDGRFPRFVR